MKIAVNTRWLLPGKLEGIGWYTHSLLKRIVQDHPEVDFHFLFDRRPGEQYQYGQNVQFHKVYPPARHPILWKIWNHITVPIRLRKIKPDLYFSPDGFAAMGWNGRQILTVHDLNFEHHPEWIPNPTVRFLQKHMALYARRADKLVCVSRTTLEDVHRTWDIPIERMDIVYNAPQDDFTPQPGLRPDLPFDKADPYFVTVGAVNPRKNLALAVRAYGLYRLTGGKGHLVMIGTRMHRDNELNRALEETPFSDGVHFVGRLEGDVLNRALSNARALLFPSLFEGFGIPIVEGMAAGTPVLCSNVSCMPEIAGEGAQLLPPHDAQVWADAMRKLENKEVREQWIERGLKRAKDFSWDQSAEILWDNILKAANLGT